MRTVRMGRSLTIGRVVAVAAALSAGALPAAAAAEPAPQSVNGSGGVLATHFTVSVSGGPFGEDPTGSLSLQGFFNFTATPTCMNIADNAGVVGFRINDGPMAGQGFLAASEPDASGRTVQYSAVLSEPPTACPPDDAPTPPNAIENGGGGSVFSGQITDAGGPPNPLPLSQQHFPLATAPTGARAITRAQAGAVWFAEPSANQLVSIANDSTKTMQAYGVPTPDAGISSVAADLTPCPGTGCGGVWFTESNANRVGHATSDGSMSESSVPSSGAQPSAIAGDPAGGAWFTEPGVNRVGRISGAGKLTESRLLTRGANPVAITATGGSTGPAGGGAWFAEKAAKRIGFVDGRGNVSEFPLPADAGAPTAIAADGQTAGAWFLEPSANVIGHIDSAGDIDQYPIPTVGASPQGLASGPGPDGHSGGAWFSETSTGQLGFISSAGQFSEFTLPGAAPGAIAFAPSIAVPPVDGYSDYEAVWWTDPVASNVSFATFPIDPASSGTSFSPPLVPPPPPPSYARLSLARRVTVRGGRMRLTLRCEGDRGQCRGLVSVTTSGVRAARATGPFAKADFGILPHHRRTLVLTLNRAGQQLLRRHRRGLAVTVSISSRGRFTASTRTATLRLG